MPQNSHSMPSRLGGSDGICCFSAAAEAAACKAADSDATVEDAAAADVSSSSVGSVLSRFSGSAAMSSTFRFLT